MKDKITQGYRTNVDWNVRRIRYACVLCDGIEERLYIGEPPKRVYLHCCTDAVGLLFKNESVENPDWWTLKQAHEDTTGLRAVDDQAGGNGDGREIRLRQ